MKTKPTTKTVAELLELRANQMLTVNPEYQRGTVWSVAQKKRLIDSIFRGYPIPLIYLHHIKKSVAGMQREDLEVIDGQQRIEALYAYREGAFKLFDPIKDEREARFPNFLKDQPCPWGGSEFSELPSELQVQFLGTKLSAVEVTTDNPNEARDLFIRLQAGLPLNAQEKRDAWPGGFSEFVLKVGGKPEIARYQGHEFFKKLMGAKIGGRGKIRQFAAQLAMLFFARRDSSGERLTDVNARAIDDYYYRNLDFDAGSAAAKRLTEVLDVVTNLLGGRKRRPLKAHEAIHLVLLADSLKDDYPPVWRDRFADAFDQFMHQLAESKKASRAGNVDEYWAKYGVWTRTNSDREPMIRIRHAFFSEKMLEYMQPLQPKDPNRLFSALDREILYFKEGRKCAVCTGQVAWDEAEVHHVNAHSKGGPTTLANAALVHRDCHPKGQAAVEFAANWKSD
jgi:hypothetical protein